MQHLSIDEPFPWGLLVAFRSDRTGHGSRLAFCLDRPVFDGSEDGRRAGFLWLYIDDLVDTRTEAPTDGGRLGPARLPAATCARDDRRRVFVDGARAGFVIGDPRPLTPIRSESARAHRQSVGLRAAFRRLEEAAGSEDDRLPDIVAPEAARVVEPLASLHRDMHAVCEHSPLLRDEIATRTAAPTRHQVFTLSILTAAFPPPPPATGVAGMNATGLLLSESDSGSVIASSIGGMASLAVHLDIGCPAPTDRPG